MRNGIVNALFVVIIALMVAVAARTVGSLIVSSMMVVPVACALQVARSWRQMYAVSALVGVVTTVAGIVVSYAFGLKPGGTIVLMAVALLLVVLVAKAVLSRLRSAAVGRKAPIGQGGSRRLGQGR